MRFLSETDDFLAILKCQLVTSVKLIKSSPGLLRMLTDTKLSFSTLPFQCVASYLTRQGGAGAGCTVSCLVGRQAGSSRPRRTR